MEMPDMLRAKGEVLTRMKSPDLSRAEHWLKESLELAHHQGALGYELRAGVSLARLWRQQGRPREAHGMLAPIHGRFTEGFDSPWLRTAEGLLKGLLDELS
jgi:predicted ATPase